MWRHMKVKVPRYFRRNIKRKLIEQLDLDFRKKEKKATKNKAQVHSCLKGVTKRPIRKSRVGVIGNLCAGAEPKKRLHPCNTSWKQYELSQPWRKTEQAMKMLNTSNMILDGVIRATGDRKKSNIS